MRANLPNASTLPFVAFVTHKGQWVGGFSGYKNADAFLKVLTAAEKTPYLQATKAVRKKLVGLAASAEKASKRGDWKSVLKASKAAAKTTGRCPERKVIAELMKQGRAWAAKQLDAVVRMAKSGGDLAEARKMLIGVKKNFLGEPEAKDANTGLKAVKRLAKIVEAEAGDSPPTAGTREKAARPYKDTRWESIFTKS